MAYQKLGVVLREMYDKLGALASGLSSLGQKVEEIEARPLPAPVTIDRTQIVHNEYDDRELRKLINELGSREEKPESCAEIKNGDIRVRQEDGTWSSWHKLGGQGGGGYPVNRFYTKAEVDALLGGITVDGETIDDRIAGLIAAGTGISVAYDDPNDTLAITNTDTGSAAVATHETTYDHDGYDAHVASTANPHAVTAAQVGAYTTAETDSAIDADIATHAASGDHDGRYYTETELDAGQLDNRYYTEAETDALLAAQDELSELDDVTITAVATGEILQYTGSVWENQTFAEADIAAASDLADYLPLAGGTMSGEIDMGGNSVTGIANGSAAAPGLAFESGRGIYDDGTEEIVISDGTNDRVRYRLQAVNTGIEFGREDGTASIVYYDFHTSATPTDFDARIRVDAGDGTIRSAPMLFDCLTTRFPSGTAAVPGIAFSADTDTGIFSSGADALDITTGGTSRLSVGSTEIDTSVPIDLNSNAISGITTLDMTQDFTLSDTGAVSFTIESSANTDVGINLSDASQDWKFGIRNAQGDAWVLAASDSLGTNQVLAADPTGAIDVYRDIDMNGNLLTAASIAENNGSDLDWRNFNPSGTNVTNVTAIAGLTSHILRVGNTYLMSGRFAASVTTAGIQTQLRLTIPIASNFVDGNQAFGSVTSTGNASVGSISSDAVNDEILLTFFPVATASTEYRFMAHIEVI